MKNGEQRWSMPEKNRKDMEHDKEFANNVYKILSSFMSNIKTVEGLERYYKRNKKAILTMQAHDNSCYVRLIDDFKKKKTDILIETKNK